MGDRLIKRLFRTPDGVSIIRELQYKKRGKWPIIHGNQLVAWIDEKGELHQSVFWTDALGAKILLMENGIVPSNTTRDLGKELPSEVIERIGSKVRRHISAITQKYHTYANEERTTGALMDALDFSMEVEGWTINVTPKGFSTQLKEPKIGADLALIVDIDRDGERTVKAVWLQAKRTARLPSNIFSLHDLSGQLAKMRRYTDSSYGLLYTPDGVYVASENEQIPFDQAIMDTTSCHRGDQSERVIASSVEAKHVVALELQKTTVPFRDRPLSPAGTPLFSLLR